MNGLYDNERGSAEKNAAADFPSVFLKDTPAAAQTAATFLNRFFNWDNCVLPQKSFGNMEVSGTLASPLGASERGKASLPVDGQVAIWKACSEVKSDISKSLSTYWELPKKLHS